jgi:hypothetical protein
MAHDAEADETSSGAMTQSLIEEVRDDPDLASYLRIEERELEAGGLS